LRALNRWLGLAEQTFLIVCLAALVGMAAGQAILGHLFGKGIRGSDEVIRYMVFFIAMGGAALAAQRLRMIGMDVLSRLVRPRYRRMLRIAHAGLVIFVCYLVVRAGMNVRAAEAASAESYIYIKRSLALLALPIGAGLIAFHYFLHIVIDLTYLLRGMESPESEALPLH
jgi:TRAP-type C4-dicarboxylate transport system permease small subunit